MWRHFYSAHVVGYHQPAPTERDVNSKMFAAPIALLAQRQLKFKPRSEYDFFHWNLRRGPEKWRERAFLFYFIFLKMERLAVKPILMRMGCCVF